MLYSPNSYSNDNRNIILGERGNAIFLHSLPILSKLGFWKTESGDPTSTGLKKWDPSKNLSAININEQQFITDLTLHSSPSSHHLMHVCVFKKTPTEILGSRSVPSNQKKKIRDFDFPSNHNSIFPLTHSLSRKII